MKWIICSTDFKTSQRILSLFCFPERERNWKQFSWLPNERNYLLNGLQNKLQIVLLITKQNKLSAQWISKFKSDYFVFKKKQKKLKIVQQITKRKKCSSQWTAEHFAGL